MLQVIRLKDFGTISNAEIELPEQGIIAITGETGAGKSTLLRALRALGDPKTATSNWTGEAGLIETEWSWDHTDWPQWIRDIGEGEDSVVLSLHQRGKQTRTRAWGQTVKAQDFEVLITQLYQGMLQGDSRMLLKRSWQTATLDRWAKLDLKPMKQAYEDLMSLRQLWQEHEIRLEKRIVLEERYKRILEDLSDHDLDANHIEDLRERRRKARSQQENMAIWQQALQRLHPAEDTSVSDLIQGAARDLQDTPYANRLMDLGLEIEALVQDIIQETQAWDEPLSLEELEEQMHIYDSLEVRYGPAETLETLKSESISELEHLKNLDDEGAQLKEKIKRAEEVAQKAASKLKKERKNAGLKITPHLLKEFKALGMEGAKLDWNFETVKLGPKGSEIGEIYIDLNGRGSKPLKEAASGGELSRIALALYLEMGLETKTVLMDEVDSGIGGQTAHLLAERLQRLGEESHQVLLVTHLPQVAKGADQHILAHKTGGQSILKILKGDELQAELKRMIGLNPDQGLEDFIHN